MFGWGFDADARYRRSSGVEWRALKNAVAVLDRNEGQLVHFSEVGSRIWQELDGKRSIAELASLLSAEFDAPRSVLEKDVDSFLRRLTKMELVEKADG